METLTIGKVAKQSGLGVETIRFYERRGLLDPPPRNDSGYRQYPVETITKLHFIKRAKTLGFSLKEIGELFNLRQNHNATCGDVRLQAQAKIKNIEEKIHDLNKMKEALAELTCKCQGQGPIRDCPILSALDPQGEKP